MPGAAGGNQPEQKKKDRSVPVQFRRIRRRRSRRRARGPEGPSQRPRAARCSETVARVSRSFYLFASFAEEPISFPFSRRNQEKQCLRDRGELRQSWTARAVSRKPVTYVCLFWHGEGKGRRARGGEQGRRRARREQVGGTWGLPGRGRRRCPGRRQGQGPRKGRLPLYPPL